MLTIPLASSLYQACTIALACFLWWMSHSESVWTLCCVLERSANFFSSVAVEKDVIFTHILLQVRNNYNQNRENSSKSNCDRKIWARDSLDFGKKPLKMLPRTRSFILSTHVLSLPPLIPELADSNRLPTWRIARCTGLWGCKFYLSNKACFRYFSLVFIDSELI